MECAIQQTRAARRRIEPGLSRERTARKTRGTATHADGRGRAQSPPGGGQAGPTSGGACVRRLRGLRHSCSALLPAVSAAAAPCSGGALSAGPRGARAAAQLRVERSCAGARVSTAPGAGARGPRRRGATASGHAPRHAAVRRPAAALLRSAAGGERTLGPRRAQVAPCGAAAFRRRRQGGACPHGDASGALGRCCRETSAAPRLRHRPAFRPSPGALPPRADCRWPQARTPQPVSVPCAFPRARTRGSSLRTRCSSARTPEA